MKTWVSLFIISCIGMLIAVAMSDILNEPIPSFPILGPLLFSGSVMGSALNAYWLGRGNRTRDLPKDKSCGTCEVEYTTGGDRCYTCVQSGNLEKWEPKGEVNQ